MKFDRRLTDEIYTSDTVRLGEDAFQTMQETIYHNGGVGTITGYYDRSSPAWPEMHFFPALPYRKCRFHL